MQKSKVFSFSLDCTSDISKIEQLPFLLYWYKLKIELLKLINKLKELNLIMTNLPLHLTETESKSLLSIKAVELLNCKNLLCLF